MTVRGLAFASIFSFGAMICISSCQKHPPYIPQADPSESCFDEIPSTAVIYHAPINFCFAQFNPGKPEEVVYMRRFQAEDFGDIWIYNLNTRQAFPIVSKLMLKVKNFSCGKHFLALETTNKEIWRIRYDGTELTKITGIKTGSHPSWNSDGTQLMVYTVKDNKGINVVMDQDGNTLKTLNTGSKNTRFTNQPDVYLGFQPGRDKNIFQYNSQYNKTIRSFPIEESDGLANVALMPNNYEMIMTKKWGIYKVNLIDTQYTVLLRDMCWRQYYDRPSLSPDGQFIVFTKTISEVQNASRINQREEIWFMDAGCLRAQRLVLP